MKVGELIKELQGYNPEKEISAAIVNGMECSTIKNPYGISVIYSKKLDRVAIIIPTDGDEE